MMMHFLTLYSSAHTFTRLFVQTAACETTLSTFGVAHCGFRVSQCHRGVSTNAIGPLTHRRSIERRLVGTRPKLLAECNRITRRSANIQSQWLRHFESINPQANQLLKHLHEPSHAGVLVIQKMDLMMSLWSSVVQARFLGTTARDLRQRLAVTNGSECKLDERGRKRVKIRACGELYQELSRASPMLYGSAPSQGIQFDVEYYDSRELLLLLSPNRKSKPLATVCLLHGAPGHYTDFESLIKYLSSKNVRVLAPNFPDYNVTYEHSFRHSPRERCEFLQEFFNAIQVQEMDMLIGHSSAVYTMFELLKRTHSIEGEPATRIRAIRSLGLFSTPSYRLPSNMEPTPFRLFTLKLFDYPLLRPLILACLLTFVKLQGIRNRVDRNKIENLLIAASAVGYSEHEKMADRLNLLKEHRIPALMVYGTNDRLIRASAFEQLERDLGATQDDDDDDDAAAAIKRYRSDGTLVSGNVSGGSPPGGGGGGGERDDNLQLVDVCRFDSGGHYTFQRYAEQVNKEVYEFLLKRVLKSVETTRM